MRFYLIPITREVNVIPTFQMKTLRLKDTESLAQGLMAQMTELSFQYRFV